MTTGEEGGVMKDQKLVILDSSVVCRSWTRSDESEGRGLGSGATAQSTLVTPRFRPNNLEPERRE